jgi:hypothetical protein
MIVVLSIFGNQHIWCTVGFCATAPLMHYFWSSKCSLLQDWHVPFFKQCLVDAPPSSFYKSISKMALFEDENLCRLLCRWTNFSFLEPHLIFVYISCLFSIHYSYMFVTVTTVVFYVCLVLLLWTYVFSASLWT